jgi:hypothetical protein
MLATVRLRGLIILAFGLAACATPAALPTAAPPDGPLVIVETRGGHCVDGPCGRTITIEWDGRVHAATEPPNELGNLTPEVLGTLQKLIATTDFQAIKSCPFTGDCPTTYDGQETVYMFSAPGGPETIESCSIAIDSSAPLFAAVDAIVAAAANEP